MYEHAAEDVDRKFSNQVCLLETDQIPKDFYYLCRDSGGIWTVYNKEVKPVHGSVKFNKLKFSYHRFYSGFYPTATPNGYAKVYRIAENKVFNQGLGGHAHTITGDVASPLDLFKSLKGTFLAPIYYTSLQYNGALSSLYRKQGTKIIDIFANQVAAIEGNTIVVMIKQQEFYDLLKRNNNYGVKNVIERQV